MSIDSETVASIMDGSLKLIDDAIQCLTDGNTGAHWEQSVIDAARHIRAVDRPTFQRKRSEIKNASNESQITEWTSEVKGNTEDLEDGTRAGKLVELTQGAAKLFHDPAGECFAAFEQEGHWETWSLASRGFSDWLSYRAYRELEFVPSDTAIKAALVTLRGIATHDGDKEEIFLRCAPTGNGYLIDLTNDQWQAVEVLPTGWSVINNPPVNFIRSKTAAPLPTPVSGNFAKLWKYANVPEEDRTLVLAHILDSWRPDTPYPVLFLTGEQGTGKSSTHKSIRQVSDPNAVPLRAAPKNVEDIFVSAGANHMASFENMSRLSSRMQDAICTLATGGGFAKRKLYTDSDESVIEVKRPVIINGIADVVTRPDLIDRTLHIEMRPLDSFTDEQDFSVNFERDKAEILGGLLDLFVNVLSRLPSIELYDTMRMIGFTKLGEAVHSVMGIDESFTELYQRNRSDSLARSMDSSPAALAVQEMMLSRNGKEWSGTVKELKTKLENSYHQEGEGWPKSPKGLGEVLRRMAPALRVAGVTVEFLGHKRDGSHVSLAFIDLNKESENKGHNRHTVTDQVKTEQIAGYCDDVTDVIVDSGKSGKPHEDTPEQSDTRVVNEL